MPTVCVEAGFCQIRSHIADLILFSVSNICIYNSSMANIKYLDVIFIIIMHNSFLPASLVTSIKQINTLAATIIIMHTSTFVYLGSFFQDLLPLTNTSN